MKHSSWTVRTSLKLLGGGTVVALALACGGGSHHEPIPPVTLTLNCGNGAAPNPDSLGLECPASSLDTLPVKVVIGGPSASSDIYGVKFDLVFDGTVLGYATHSAGGSFLAKEGGTVNVLASVPQGDPNRLVVVVGLEGAVSGVQVTGSVETVAQFLFQGVGSGTSTVRFENGEVVDSTLKPIASLNFMGELLIEIP